MPFLSDAQVIDLIQRGVTRCGSQTALAAEMGISVQYLSDVLHGRRSPGQSVLTPLGLRHVSRYEYVAGSRPRGQRA